jgi:hypothetical protein
MKRLLILTSISVSFLVMPIAAFAQSGWTTACSAGATIDEASRNLYGTFANYLTFRAGQIGNVQARYDVTNASSPSMVIPPWQTLELDCVDNAAGDVVTATLFQYTACDGNLQQICTVASTDVGQQCVVCQFPAGSINFFTNVYWVTVNMTRNNANDVVRANSVRVY